MVVACRRRSCGRSSASSAISASCTELSRGSGLQLLDQQREQDGEETHAPPMIPARPAAQPHADEEAVEVAQHRRGRAPDEVARAPAVGVDAVPRHRQELAAHAGDLERMAAVVGRVHQERQRHLEDLGHLERIGREREAAAAPAPTTGVTMKRGDRSCRSAARRAPRHARAARPISSCASRSAVATASASSGSARPPGKLIWPGMVGAGGRCAASAAPSTVVAQRPAAPAPTHAPARARRSGARPRSRAPRRAARRSARAARRGRKSLGGDRRQVVVDAEHRHVPADRSSAAIGRMLLASARRPPGSRARRPSRTCRLGAAAVVRPAFP